MNRQHERRTVAVGAGGCRPDGREDGDRLCLGLEEVHAGPQGRTSLEIQGKRSGYMGGIRRGGTKEREATRRVKHIRILAKEMFESVQAADKKTATVERGEGVEGP